MRALAAAAAALVLAGTAPTVLTGVLRPARRAAVRIYRDATYVTSVRSGAGRRFRARVLLRKPGRYEARSGGARSRPRAIRVRPRLEASLDPLATLNGRLVYRKVSGFNWVLWYPLYFLRGFAIHGYPSVPAYQASHGCVRVPRWIAPSLYARHGYGTTIVVYA